MCPSVTDVEIYVIFCIRIFVRHVNIFGFFMENVKSTIWLRENKKNWALFLCFGFLLSDWLLFNQTLLGVCFRTWNYIFTTIIQRVCHINFTFHISISEVKINLVSISTLHIWNSWEATGLILSLLDFSIKHNLMLCLPTSISLYYTCITSPFEKLRMGELALFLSH